MAKIAVLLPKEFMVEQAERVLQNGNYDIHSIKVINSLDAISEARNAVSTGASVIISRGYQAKLIQENTNIAVAELNVSVQDLGLLINKAKEVTGKEFPRIAIVAFRNMIEDTSYFKELFNVELIEYYIESFDEMDYVIQKLIDNNIDIALGGETMIRMVSKYNIPTMFLASTENSIENALKLAKKMAFAIDIEKSSKAYMDTVMETSFNGIIKIDNGRHITAVNRSIENMLERKTAEIAGTLLEKVFPEINVNYVNDVLAGKKENYSTSIRINGTPVMLVMAPIIFENEVFGAIISSRKLDVVEGNSENIRDMIMNGFTAKYKFSSIDTVDKQYMDNLELAKKYAIVKSPVLIVSKDNIEAEKVAQSIHNNSSRKNAPYISINCSGLNENEQDKLLFGDDNIIENKVLNKGVLESCNLGTLYIEEIDKLSLLCQYKLLKIINCLPVFKPEFDESKKYDIKIIVSSGKELWSMVEKGNFRYDLYYSICPFIVRIPSINNRTADIEKIIDSRLKIFTDKFTTYMSITPEAKSTIKSYNWAGNEIQLNFFCDRLFLTTNKRVIDECHVKSLFEDLYPNVEVVNSEEHLVIYRHPEAKKIIELLDKHRGNRNSVANELEISTTTLWRRMKKYGILSKYDN